MNAATSGAIHEFCSTALGQWAPIDRLLETAELILQAKPEVIVEIGVFGGRSMIPQALALKENGKGRIYGIDPWKAAAAVEGENPENAKWWSENVDLHDVHRAAVEAIWKYGLDEFAILIRSTSQDCCSLFAPNTIDLLTIDGNHSEIASCRDVANYLPCVKPGGMIIFDDANWPSTQKALDLLGEVADLDHDGGDYRRYVKKEIPQ